MRTALKGNATEAAVLNALASRGLAVLLPFGGGLPYDLVVHLADRSFLKVQCKTVRLVKDCVVFNAHRTDHGAGRRPYDGLADVFGVYFQLTQAVYLVPVHDVSSIGPRLRLKPTRNNQAQGIRYAADYEIARWSVDALREVVKSTRAGADATVASVA
ncbi:MAG: group I intron-associated PD-(D/E)XK endonuclease [Solirubrobacterales bacterium]